MRHTRCRKEGPSCASVGLVEYPQNDVLVLRYRPVIFGAVSHQACETKSTEPPVRVGDGERPVTTWAGTSDYMGRDQ